MLYAIAFGSKGCRQIKYIDAPSDQYTPRVGKEIIVNFLKKIDINDFEFVFVSDDYEDKLDLILDESGIVVFDKHSTDCIFSYKTWSDQVRIAKEHMDGFRNNIYRGYIVDGDERVSVHRNYGSISQNALLPLKPSLALNNHSPDGYAWGYNGSGPAQLALAILLYEFGDPIMALEYYQDFKTAIISNLEKEEDWLMSGEFVRHWVNTNKCAEKIYKR